MEDRTMSLDKLLYNFARRRTIDNLALTGVSTTIGAETFNVLLKNSVGDILLATGTTVPTDAGDGFAKGCYFIDTDVATGSQGVYINVGTSASCNFDVLGAVAGGYAAGDLALATGSMVIGVAGAGAALDLKGDGKILIGNGTTATSVAVTGDITVSNAGLTAIGAGKVLASMLNEKTIQYSEVAVTSVNITDTAAGHLGHANGVVLVADPGATKFVELLSAVLIYDFGGAGYADGGNVTINVNGGAPITGLVSAANSLGASADKIVVFNPLSVAAFEGTANKGLNLVSSAAFTNGGAATGTIRIKTAYRVHTHGL
jgi:hypothetical protein